MKINTFSLLAFIFCVFLARTSFAQTLPELDIPLPSHRYEDICRTLDAYFLEHHDEAESDCWDNNYVKYQRWKWFWRDRVQEDGSFPDLRKQWLEQQKARTETIQQRSAMPQWQSEGPSSVVEGGYWGIGRCKHVAFHPTDPQIMYAGTPDGGLWKTEDGGGSWTSLGDALPYLPVSVILIDPQHPDTLYISLGDKGGWWMWNLGVYKSTDGGLTWAPTALDWALSEEYVIYNMVMSPSDPQTIFVASNKGIFRTQNGGNSWNSLRNGEFTDICYRPGDSTTLYAAQHDYWGKSQLIRSDDGGINWAQISDFQETQNTINLTVTPLMPDWLGVRSSNGKKFYLSKNRGDSLAYKSEMPEDAHFQLSPSDSNVVYTSGVVVYRSEDQGSNWTQITNWYNNGIQTEVHADVHDIVPSPHDKEQLFFCNDGGLYSYHEPSEIWEDLSDGLSIAQFYRVAVSASGNLKIAAGSQDNGGWLRQASGTWKHTNGGDAMCQIIDPSNSSTLYTEYYGGLSIYRSTNNFVTSVDIAENIADDPQGDWVTPFILNPRNPKTFIVGFHDIYRSFDRGDNFHKISENLTGSVDNKLRDVVMSSADTNFIAACRANVVYTSTDGGLNWSNHNVAGAIDITRLAVHPKSNGGHIIWASKGGYSSGKKLYKSVNNGIAWQNISGNLPNVPVNCVLFDSISNYLFVGTDIGVFYSDADVIHWEAYGQGLPAVYVLDLVLRPSTRKIYAATHGRGVYSVDIESIVKTHSPDEKHADWTIYPNPASTLLFFKSGDEQIFSGTLSLCDALGRQMLSKNIREQALSNVVLDVSSLPGGIYFLKGADPLGKVLFGRSVSISH